MVKTEHWRAEQRREAETVGGEAAVPTRDACREKQKAGQKVGEHAQKGARVMGRAVSKGSGLGFRNGVPLPRQEGGKLGDGSWRSTVASSREYQPGD